MKFLLISLLLFQLTPVSGPTYEAIRSEIIVTGSYNDTTWEMTSEKAKCNAAFIFKNSNLTGVKSIIFSVEVKDLKGHTSLMDKRAQKALKAYPYESITYTGKIFKVSALGNKRFLLKTEGNLRIAGITRIISLSVTSGVNEEGTMTCTGSKRIQMSDFNVRLPQVLKDNLKVGNIADVSFNLVLGKI